MSEPTYQFFLQKSNQYLDKNDAFKAPAYRHPDAKPFDTEAAALDKAEAMGLNLDRIYVVKAKKREEAPKSG